MIAVENVIKEYHAYRGKRRVLDNISFSVTKGERIAIFGRNGSGKSTLIKIIGGVLWPNSGRVVRRMSVSWPLGYGGAFQSSLTGFDNMRFIARIYNADFDAMHEFVDDFAELGVQLRMPLKTYSSGMRARLAFALSLAIDFDCYLIDEVMAAGDQRFHQKCQDQLFGGKEDRSFIIATHDMEAARQTCSSAMVLQNGRATRYADIDEAIGVYAAL